MNTNVHFSQTLRRIRKERKLSQQEFAEVLDLPLNSYKSYELSRREPSIQIASKISSVLGISLDELIRGSTSAKEESIKDLKIADVIDILHHKVRNIPDDILEILSGVNTERDWDLIRTRLKLISEKNKEEDENASNF